MESVSQSIKDSQTLVIRFFKTIKNSFMMVEYVRVALDCSKNNLENALIGNLEYMKTQICMH